MKEETVNKMTKIIAGVICLAISIALPGCACSKGEESNVYTPAPTEKDKSPDNEMKTSSDGSYTGGWGLLSDEAVQEFVDIYDQIEAGTLDEIESRKTSEPIWVKLGDEVDVTNNLAVRVIAVEAGPYDYADNTDTVKVTVEMRNKTDKTLTVKASNINADTVDGRRVNHKLYIKDADGNKDTRSFLPTTISPGATFTGAVYFDGSDLVDVVYVPHWLVSSQNQYVYWEINR